MTAGVGDFSVRGMNRLKIILMGSGTLACPLLEGIFGARRDELVAVVTQPDRAGGRGMQCMTCALKPLAVLRLLLAYQCLG